MPAVMSKDGTRIAYDRSGQGPAVILVDGATGHRNYQGGRALAEKLADDFTAISYDRRGRGESTDTPPYEVAREIEDIEALIDEIGAPAHLYGISSGAVLALRAAAALGAKVAKLAVLEPPFGSDDDQEKREFADYVAETARLLDEGRRADAVALFFADMLPAEMIEGMKQTPDWAELEAVAHTLAYDNLVMGDGSVPTEIAGSVTAPALVLVGSESPEFKHQAAETLTAAMPNAQHRVLEGQHTLVAPDILAPVLTQFFK